MKTFDAAFDALIGHEGGYSNNPKDPGGETMFGVTARVARAHGYVGPMRDLPLATAKNIAKATYWDVVRGDELPAELDFQMFDTAYNSGPGRAILLLQRALDVLETGKLDRNTWGQIEKTVMLNEVDSLCARFNGERLEFLASLSTWPTFARGWARRIAGNLKRIR